MVNWRYTVTLENTKQPQFIAFKTNTKIGPLVALCSSF
jgi:hypothetical protein